MFKKAIAVFLVALFLVIALPYLDYNHQQPVISALSTAEIISASSIVIRSEPWTPESNPSSVRGSGTYYTNRGRPYIYTAAHVLKAFAQASLLTGTMLEAYACYRPDNRGCDPTEICVRIEWATTTQVVDPYDVALVRLSEPLPAIPAQVEFDYQWTIGEEVWLTGAPGGILSIHQGNLSGSSGQGFMFTNAEAWPGSSGGGVWNEQGRLIGIISNIRFGRAPWSMNFEAVEGNRGLVLIPPGLKTEI